MRDSAGRPRVLFVCQGNICRSPFAAALLRARLGDNDAISVGSAGMMPQPGRPTPAFGLQAAAAFGIDLAAHRSAWLTREAAEAASLLVVFDEINRIAVFDRYPDLTVPVIRLDELGQPGEIADPVDGGLEEFQRCYQRIAAGVAELVEVTQRVPPKSYARICNDRRSHPHHAVGRPDLTVGEAEWRDLESEAASGSPVFGPYVHAMT